MRHTLRLLATASAVLVLLLLVTGRPRRVHDESRAAATAASSPRARVRVAPAPGDPALVPATPTATTQEPVRQPRAGVGRSIRLADLPWHPEGPRSPDLGEVARGLLTEHAAALGLGAMPGELLLEREFDSLSGRHVRFVQALHGVPVDGSRVAAHVAADGRPLLVQADAFPLAGWAGTPDETLPRIDAAAARAAVAEFVTDVDETAAETAETADADAAGVEPDVREPELVILPQGHGAVLAWKCGVRTDDETLLVYVDARDGAVLAARDLRVAAEGRAAIFDPNPVHSEGDRTLTDRGDDDYAALDRARRVVTLSRLDGTGFVRGQWVDTTASPVAAFSSGLDWIGITRSHSSFEQLMAYYHLDRVQEQLQALGIENANAERQRVNAHARSADQSNYDVLDDVLEFGDGGVDDAEDADIVVHEYGHAMQFDQVGDFGRTGEGGAMGEGFSDFLAVVFHESARPTWDVLVASWDATSYSNASPPFLRRVDGNKTYPDDTVGQVHDDGEIWSAFLWDLRQLLGSDDALRVVVEAHFFLTPNARFKNGVEALIVANIAVRDGRDDASIRALADARGLPHDLPAAPLPPEEASEDNDTLATAAPLDSGVHERLLLADDDWFRVRVPALTRVLLRAEFDPAAMDLDLAGHDAEGRVAAVSESVSGSEEIAASAGAEPYDLLVRVYHNPGDIRPGAYDLVVTETALEAFGPKQTVVLRMEPGTQFAFRLGVDAVAVEGGASLSIKTRKLRRGAKADLRLFAPDGQEVVDIVAAKRRKGGRADVVADQVGDWIGVATSRDGSRGRYRLKVKLK